MNKNLLAAECLIVGALWLIVVNPTMALVAVACFMVCWVFRKR